jgi:hypothetical protein
MLFAAPFIAKVFLRFTPRSAEVAAAPASRGLVGAAA